MEDPRGRGPLGAQNKPGRLISIIFKDPSEISSFELSENVVFKLVNVRDHHLSLFVKSK